MKGCAYFLPLFIKSFVRSIFPTFKLDFFFWSSECYPKCIIRGNVGNISSLYPIIIQKEIKFSNFHFLSFKIIRALFFNLRFSWFL